MKRRLAKTVLMLLAVSFALVIHPVTAFAALPTPYWWNGDCDKNDDVGSKRLGAVYLGMPACGPTGTSYAQTDFPGRTQYQWQCAELSKRYLYLAFGQKAYQADGFEVVSNYPGNSLVKVENGDPQRRWPVAGDVMSWGTTAPGHTNVVTSVSYDAAGTGTIYLIEQNASANGATSVKILAGIVQDLYGRKSNGWLHSPGGGSPSFDGPAVALQSNGAPTVFVRGANNTLWNYWYANGSWLSANIGQAYSAPAVTLQANGAPTVFVRGANNTLWNYWYANGSWLSANIGQAYSAPAVGLQSNGAPTVFVQGASNSLRNYWYANGSWLSANIGQAYSAPAVTRQSNGAPSVFVRGANNTLWNYWYLSVTGTWASSNIGQAYSAPAVTLQSNDAPTVFVQGSGNTLRNYWYSNGSWLMANIGQAYSGPAVALQSNGAPTVFVRGANSTLWNYWYLPSNSSWLSANIAGAQTTFSVPAVALQSNGAPTVFVVGPSNSMWNYWYLPAGATWASSQVAANGTTY